MVFDVQYGELYRKNIGTFLANKLEIPEQWKNPKFPNENYEDIYVTFGLLSTERQIGFSVGPIPYSKIQLYCKDLDEDIKYIYIQVILRLDKEYLNQIDIKQKKETENAKRHSTSGKGHGNTFK